MLIFITKRYFPYHSHDFAHRKEGKEQDRVVYQQLELCVCYYIVAWLDPDTFDGLFQRCYFIEVRWEH
jgi:hypothetical protein